MNWLSKWEEASNKFGNNLIVVSNGLSSVLQTDIESERKPSNVLMASGVKVKSSSLSNYDVTSVEVGINEMTTLLSEMELLHHHVQSDRHRETEIAAAIVKSVKLLAHNIKIGVQITNSEVMAELQLYKAVWGNHPFIRD